ncbi:hypothetical protein LTR85_006932 [Meristemomyces frigidus]|nr:hypothetical protein LTR85_006932 [Meristemomyces frigidus]
MTVARDRRSVLARLEDADGDYVSEKHKKVAQKRRTTARRSVLSRSRPNQLEEQRTVASKGVDSPVPVGAPTSRRRPASSKREQAKFNSAGAVAVTSDVVQDSLLLRLPKELQIHILGYVLIQIDRHIKLQSASDRRWRNEILELGKGDLPRPIKSSLLDVLLVCKSFYYTGIEAFYGGNMLRFRDLDQLQRFMRSMQSDRRRCIKRTEVWVE